MSVPLATHAITYAKRYARANMNRLAIGAGDKFTEPSPAETVAQRLSSFGFRGTSVGEFWGIAPDLEEMMLSFELSDEHCECIRQKHWVYAGVGCYTVQQHTLWIINLGGADA
jgi:uncharacterized protein YkwD